MTPDRRIAAAAPEVGALIADEPEGADSTPRSSTVNANWCSASPRSPVSSYCRPTCPLTGRPAAAVAAHETDRRTGAIRQSFVADAAGSGTAAVLRSRDGGHPHRCSGRRRRRPTVASVVDITPTPDSDDGGLVCDGMWTPSTTWPARRNRSQCNTAQWLYSRSRASAACLSAMVHDEAVSADGPENPTATGTVDSPTAEGGFRRSGPRRTTGGDRTRQIRRSAGRPIPQPRVVVVGLQQPCLALAEDTSLLTARTRQVPGHLHVEPRRVLHGPRRRAQAPRRNRAVGPVGRRALTARAIEPNRAADPIHRDPPGTCLQRVGQTGARRRGHPPSSRGADLDEGAARAPRHYFDEQVFRSSRHRRRPSRSLHKRVEPEPGRHRPRQC